MTLLALLKHPLWRIGTDHAIATLERAILRGPRPRPGARGLAHALQTFRGLLDKFRSGDKVDLHRSDPRTALSDAALQAAADLVAGLGGHWRRWKTSALRRAPSASLPIVIAPSSPPAAATLAFTGPDGTKLADALDELATSAAAAAWRSRHPITSSCLPQRLPAGSCGGQPDGARAHPRPAGSASHRERSRRARRPGRRHLAAGKPHRCLAQPADAAQARPRSAGTPHRFIRP